jgi:hypothetical protein
MKFGVTETSSLTGQQKAVAFQRTVGALLMIEDEGEIAFLRGQRHVVQGHFARYFDGVLPPGPPWRIDPYEPLPTYAEWFDNATSFV